MFFFVLQTIVGQRVSWDDLPHQNFELSNEKNGIVKQFQDDGYDTTTIDHPYYPYAYSINGIPDSDFGDNTPNMQDPSNIIEINNHLMFVSSGDTTWWTKLQCPFNVRIKGPS